VIVESVELITEVKNNLEDLDATVDPDCEEVISAAVEGLLILICGRRL
jgi:hypothetical protein